MPWSPIPRVTINLLGFPATASINGFLAPCPCRRLVIELPNETSKQKLNTISDLILYVKQDATLVNDAFIDMQKSVLYTADFVPLAKNAPIGILRDGDVLICAWHGGAEPVSMPALPESGQIKQQRAVEEYKKEQHPLKHAGSADYLDSENDSYIDDKHRAVAVADVHFKPMEPVNSSKTAREALLPMETKAQAAHKQNAFDDEASRKINTAIPLQQHEKQFTNAQEFSRSVSSLSSNEDWGDNNQQSAQQRLALSATTPLKDYDIWSDARRPVSTKEQLQRGTGYDMEPSFDDYNRQVQPSAQQRPSGTSLSDRHEKESTYKGNVSASRGYNEDFIAPSGKAISSDKTSGSLSGKSQGVEKRESKQPVIKSDRYNTPARSEERLASGRAVGEQHQAAEDGPRYTTTASSASRKKESDAASGARSTSQDKSYPRAISGKGTSSMDARSPVTEPRSAATNATSLAYTPTASKAVGKAVGTRN